MTDGGCASTFDVAGRMVTNTVNSGVTTYVYDGDGQRVMKQNWCPAGHILYRSDRTHPLQVGGGLAGRLG